MRTAILTVLLVGSLLTTSMAQADGPPETLTVARVGDGIGLVTSTDGIINCGATCSHLYDYGSQVTLEEWTFVEGSSFEGWSGACSGADHNCTVSMNEAQSVSAKFLRDCRPPRLRGLRLQRAREALASHDCRTGEITRARSRTVRSGRVISQRPKPSTVGLEHGARVSLVISTG